MAIKLIRDIIIDTSNIKASGEVRAFNVLGEQGAVFSLQVKNEDSSYYNFDTQAFQTAETKLSAVKLTSTQYDGTIKFPSVSDADHYDIYLFAELNEDTKHSEYIEVRRDDNTIDINSSKGSNSGLVQKIIYQTLDVTVTLNSFSPNGTVTGTVGNQEITTSRDKSTSNIPFSFPFTVTSTRTLSILKQPSINDILSYVSLTVGAAPLTIDDEDIYPAASNTDDVGGDFSAASGHKIVMVSSVASNMAVGDKITSAETTSTVGGSSHSFDVPLADGDLKIILDEGVGSKASVGDRITIDLAPSLLGMGDVVALFDSHVFVVGAINPDGDNANEFSVNIEGSRPEGTNDDGSGAYIIPTGSELRFSSRTNRELVKVGALNPDTDNVREFSVVDSSGSNLNIGFREEQTLTFSNQRNYRWPVSNIYYLTEGMRTVAGTNFSAAPTIKEYLTQTTYLEGTPNEFSVDNVRVPGIEPAGTSTTPSTPVRSRNATTNVETITQTGNVVFSHQANLDYAGDTIKLFSYGTDEIKRMTGYELEFSDLKVELAKITTTTTSAVANSTSVPITARDGIMDGISTVKGIGIGAGASTPTVSSGAGSVTGAGTIVLSSAQTLEKGITLTFPGAGSVATISGNIKINKVGNENVLLSFDLEKILKMH